MSSLETNALQQDKIPEEESQVCAVNQLIGLGISGTMTLEAIEFQLLELDSVLANCQQLDDRYVQLMASLPPALYPCFKVSTAGIEQLAAMINLIQSAPQALWLLRDQCFKHYEMDFRLSKLQQYLDILKPLNKKLTPFVNINALGSASTLGFIQRNLDNTGMFRWFSSKWRNAKQQALTLASNEQLKLDDIKLLLPAMIKYVHTQECFDDLFVQVPILSASHRGLKTNIAPLLAVREWYKDVEFAITAHFSGEHAILAGLSILDKQEADKLVAVYTHDLMKSIKKIDSQINKLRLSFPECQVLQQDGISYLTSVRELKAVVVTQLSILKNNGVDTEICLSEC